MGTVLRGACTSGAFASFACRESTITSAGAEFGSVADEEPQAQMSVVKASAKQRVIFRTPDKRFAVEVQGYR